MCHQPDERLSFSRTPAKYEKDSIRVRPKGKLALRLSCGETIKEAWLLTELAKRHDAPLMA
jgi:hypothetical protein